MRKPKPSEAEILRYAQFGRASLIPGLAKAVDYLQEMLDDLRRQLMEMEAEQAVPRRKKPGRPKLSEAGREAIVKAAHSNRGERGWSDDPEERKREMKRRFAKRKKNAESRLHKVSMEKTA